VINIYIGYDEHHSITYDACKFSIIKGNSKYDINVIPINYNTINSYDRIMDKYESTQFSFARFWVPYESNYKGISIFCDSDFIFMDSIDNLIDLYDDRYAIMCCQHNYTPNSDIKMNGKIQSSYPRKNWSSLMIFNNEHPKNKTLNPLTLNNQSGAFLHRFNWLDDNEIGSLPLDWNYLVGYYTGKDPKALHYTDGGPWLKGYENCKYSDIWYEHKNKICKK